MNIKTIVSSVFKKATEENSIQKNLEDYLGKKLDDQNIIPEDLYSMEDYKNSNNIESLLVNFTEEKISEKIFPILETIEERYNNNSFFYAYKDSLGSTRIIFLIVNGGNGEYGDKEMAISINEINDLFNYLVDESDKGNLKAPRIRCFYPDLPDSVFYWILEFYV